MTRITNETCCKMFKRKKSFLYFLSLVFFLSGLILFHPFSLFSNPSQANANLTWLFTDCEARSVIQTADGGFVLTGIEKTYNDDGWIIKTDAEGTFQWGYQYNYVRRSSCGFYSVIQSNDGGFVLTGNTDYSENGGGDIWLVKTDKYGTVQWNRTYGTNENEYGYSVIQTTDGNFVIGGSVDSYTGDRSNADDPLLLKVDSNGNKMWMRFYEWPFTQRAYSVIQTIDEGYALAGCFTARKADGGWGYDMLLLKTDKLGLLEWNQTYSGKEDYHVGKSLTQITDGGYALVGYVRSPMYVLFVRTDMNGTEKWRKMYGESLKGSNAIGHAVKKTDDGGYIFAGSKEEPNKYESDIWLVKINSDGELEWDRTYGNEYDDCAYSVIQTSDGGFVVVGTIGVDGLEDDGCVIKFDVNGFVEWSHTYNEYFSASTTQPSSSTESTDNSLIFLLLGLLITSVEYSRQRKISGF